jgi:hypothetical protein
MFANKVKVLVYQFAHNSLQVKTNIAMRGIKLGHSYVQCATGLVRTWASSF